MTPTTPEAIGKSIGLDAIAEADQIACKLLRTVGTDPATTPVVRELLRSAFLSGFTTGMNALQSVAHSIDAVRSAAK